MNLPTLKLYNPFSPLPQPEHSFVPFSHVMNALHLSTHSKYTPADVEAASCTNAGHYATQSPPRMNGAPLGHYATHVPAYSKGFSEGHTPTHSVIYRLVFTFSSGGGQPTEMHLYRPACCESVRNALDSQVNAQSLSVSTKPVHSETHSPDVR